MSTLLGGKSQNGTGGVSAERTCRTRSGPAPSSHGRPRTTVPFGYVSTGAVRPCVLLSLATSYANGMDAMVILH